METITNVKKNDIPYIFIIDLDGTIIGDCTYQCDIYNIQEIINKTISTTQKRAGDRKYKMICEKSLNESYNSHSKLIRPFFVLFIKKMKKRYPECCFFVYTASEKTWALKEISMIEKHNNIKLNRPIFTRDDCVKDSNGNLRKSVVKIIPRILKVIKKPSNTILKNNILVIDNNPFFIDYTENLILCPTYDYIKFQNLWDNVPDNFNKIDELKRYINRLIITKKMHSKTIINDDFSMEKNYKWMYKKYKKINKNNLKYENDTFWKDLVSHIEKNDVQKFNNTSVSKIQKNISK